MDEGWVRAAGAGLRISTDNGTALPLSYTRKLVPEERNRTLDLSLTRGVLYH